MSKFYNCFFYNCSTCLNGICVKESFLGTKYYICKPYPKKHKKINGGNCAGFVCAQFIKNSVVCEDCGARPK